MTRRPSAVHTLVVFSGVLALAGCSGSKKGFALKGSVSYQGKPLPSGVVRLYMAENRVTMARIQPDGSFEATEVFPGEAKATVEEDPTARMRKMMPATGAAAGVPAAAGPMNRFSLPSVPLPAKYKDTSTSGLTFTLKADDPLIIELN
jgi:hypothetical protein